MPSILKPITDRLRGPGGVYNLGNMIGLGGGLCAAVLAVPHEALGLSTAMTAAADFIYGSPAAIVLTLATLVFFWSGEEYHRAWSGEFPPDERRVRSGDLSSALGAVLLAGAFFALGNVVLALTAGLMHAAGKLGSAMAPGRNSTRCREIVLLSRLPAIAMAISGLMVAKQGAGGGPAIVSAVLLICCLIWTVADMMLLPGASVLSPRHYLARSASISPLA